jgi:hypothetical protein
MLSLATVTIASLRVIARDLPGTRTTKGKIVDKNNNLIIKTRMRIINTIAPSQSYCL